MITRFIENDRTRVIDIGQATVLGGGFFNHMLLAYYTGEMTVAVFIEHNRAEREQMRRDWFGLD